VNEKRVYSGWIAEHDLGDATDILFLSEISEPLAEALQDDLHRFGDQVSVRYFVSDEKRFLDELQENLVRQIAGDAEADYGSNYSEITGYLWTDEELKVGGHDLLAELRTHKGRYCVLEFTWRAAEQPERNQ
jgi:hypothetical protein